MKKTGVWRSFEIPKNNDFARISKEEYSVNIGGR